MRGYLSKYILLSQQPVGGLKIVRVNRHRTIFLKTVSFCQVEYRIRITYRSQFLSRQVLNYQSTRPIWPSTYMYALEFNASTRGAPRRIFFKCSFHRSCYNYLASASYAQAPTFTFFCYSLSLTIVGVCIKLITFTFAIAFTIRGNKWLFEATYPVLMRVIFSSNIANT